MVDIFGERFLVDDTRSERLVIGALTNRALVATPARIKQMFDLTRHSIRRLNELVNSLERHDPRSTKSTIHHQIISELAIANAYHRQLVRALRDSGSGHRCVRTGPFCLVMSGEKINDLDRTLRRLAGRLRLMGIH